jgi:hypothetical protein
MCRILLDNDIVAKAVAYRLVEELLTVLKIPANELGVLGTLVYVLSPKRLRTAPDGGESACERLRAFVASTHVLEPTDAESRLAILFEEAAQEAEADLDVGESQIFAIAVCREVQKVCTGDKRAITALEILRQKVEEISRMDGRVVPLEELARAMVEAHGHERIRERICAAEGTDLALEICFQCHNEHGDPTETEAGLKSYLSSLRRTAPTMCGDL